jgi:hypothetical protein
MRVKVKVSNDPPNGIASDLDEALPDYPLRISSFLASVTVHGGVVALLFTVASFRSTSDRPVYDEFIKPHELKIIYYHSPPKVPDVKPLDKGNRLAPRGVELSKQAIIATSPKPKSKVLFVSTPAPALDVTLELPAPLLVAKLDTTIAPPPERPKPKQFVPPPPAKRDPPLPLQMQVLDSPSLPSALPAPPSMLPTPTFSLTPPPPKKAPEAAKQQSGSATVDIAVASLHPSDKKDAPLPNAERPAQFSKAPEQGPAASGGVNQAAVTVPNLTIRQPQPDVAPPSPTQQILYADIVRSLPQATISAPLRLSSRSIPPAVDARFQGRDVYTIVIPMEHMPVYSGDWVMWFADRQNKPGQTPLVRAPVPLRKLEIVDRTPPSDRTRTRVQLAASLGRNGTLDGVMFLTQVSPAIQRAVLQDVASWEFRPATSDGAPIDVDIVLEIYFSLPATLAKGP